MCGRYAIYVEEDNIEMREIIRDINERFSKIIIKPGEAFPTNILPAVVKGQNGNGVYYDNIPLKWGLPNNFSKTGVIINARSESLFEKRMFRPLIHGSRCLLPASCFFEWKTGETGKKQKYSIRPASSSCFYLAGIHHEGCFAIITTDANPQMEPIHNRMPVFFAKRDIGMDWLNDNDAAAIGAKLTAYEDELIIKAA